jgi:hypothetical protein
MQIPGEHSILSPTIVKQIFVRLQSLNLLAVAVLRTNANSEPFRQCGPATWWFYPIFELMRW